MYDKRARAVIKFVSNTSFIQRSNIIDTIARPELRVQSRFNIFDV